MATFNLLIFYYFINREPSDAHLNSMLERLFLETNGSVRVSDRATSIFYFKIFDVLQDAKLNFSIRPIFFLLASHPSKMNFPSSFLFPHLSFSYPMMRLFAKF